MRRENIFKFPSKKAHRKLPREQERIKIIKINLDPRTTSSEERSMTRNRQSETETILFTREQTLLPRETDKLLSRISSLRT